MHDRTVTRTLFPAPGDGLTTTEYGLTEDRSALSGRLSCHDGHDARPNDDGARTDADRVRPDGNHDSHPGDDACLNRDPLLTRRLEIDPEPNDYAQDINPFREEP